MGERRTCLAPDAKAAKGARPKSHELTAGPDPAPRKELLLAGDVNGERCRPTDAVHAQPVAAQKARGEARRRAKRLERRRSTH